MPQKSKDRRTDEPQELTEEDFYTEEEIEELLEDDEITTAEEAFMRGYMDAQHTLWFHFGGCLMELALEVETESHIRGQVIQLDETAAITQAIRKNCIVAYY